MIAEALHEIRSQLPEGVQLVAVSKFHPVEELRTAYDAGQRLFGESHVQEMTAKQPLMPNDTAWHFIGHLQTNKVKYIAPYVSLIHAVDSLKLLREIDKQGLKAGRNIPCLLELHLAQEETKYGFSPEEIVQLLETETLDLPHVELRGLMTMATYTSDMRQVHKEFQQARQCFELVKRRFFPKQDNFCELSMGMSHDYMAAIEEGATIIRVGTKIFGKRRY